MNILDSKFELKFYCKFYMCTYTLTRILKVSQEYMHKNLKSIYLYVYFEISFFYIIDVDAANFSSFSFFFLLGHFIEELMYLRHKWADKSKLNFWLAIFMMENNIAFCMLFRRRKKNIIKVATVL